MYVLLLELLFCNMAMTGVYYKKSMDRYWVLVEKVRIQDNVFIGANTTILKGADIGENVIIGANSLVNKKLDDNGVYAGNQ